MLMRGDQGGLEFASPIIRYEQGSSWRQDLHSHFQILESYAEIMTDVTCGTHIHVSPGDSEWTLEQVKNVSRSILYFEEAFEVLLPPERRGNRECRSNRFENPKLKHLPDLAACFQKVHQCTTIKALVHLMNAKEEDPSRVSEESNGEKAVTERCYGFNFENLMEGKIGTIGKPPFFRKFHAQCTHVEVRVPKASLCHKISGLRFVGRIRGCFHASSHAIRYRRRLSAELGTRCDWSGRVHRASYHTRRE